MLSFVLGFAALYVTDPAAGVAIWWPATGVSALILLLHRGPRWHALIIVASVGILSNVAVGRPLDYAITGAVILGLEMVAFGAVLGRTGPGALLSTAGGLGRLLLAVAAAATTIGVSGALSLHLLAGLDPVQTFFALLPSHASALLLIVPLALVPLRPRGERIPAARVVEGALQLASTIVVAVLVFSPVLPVPLLFTLFPLFAWAASRFTALFIVVELLVVALIVPTITVLTGGPFRELFAVAAPGRVVQVFMVSAAITALFLTVVRTEREQHALARERQAALMRGGFLGSQVAFLVVRSTRDGVRVLEANATATELIDRGWLPLIVGDWLPGAVGELNRELTLPDGRSWHAFGSLVPAVRGDIVAGIQLVDVSDHVAAREAMAHAIDRERAVADELRDLAQQKDDFVSAVSHELRTPITSIIGFAEDLDETAGPEQRTMTEVIVRNSNRLAGMVEQLLELGRMTSPNPVGSAGVVDLNQVLAETAHDQTRGAEAAGVAVRLDLDASEPCVIGDDASIQRIVTNLLSNAVKFTPPGGLVRLTTSVEGDSALITIDDSGVGISAPDRQRIFERFFRSGDQRKLSAPGTGLGLSIVRSLVELLRGSVDVHDSPLGGTRFIVRLRLVEGSPAPELTARA